MPTKGMVVTKGGYLPLFPLNVNQKESKKMKKIVVLASLVLSFQVVLFSQHILKGVVVDAIDGAPLLGTNIAVEGSFIGAVSSSSGHFQLSGLPGLEVTLRISYVGYQTLCVNVRLPHQGILDIRLEPTMAVAQEVVVAGLRADARTPATYTNINKHELAPRNTGQDLPFLLGLTPSLVASSDAGAGVGYTSLKIRGSDDTRINVTINGVPLNDPESHGVWWVNMPDIVSSVENIQVQRGVGLSTHGAGAFGATISLKTSGLTQNPAAFLDNSVGSFSTMKNTVGFSTGLLKNGWAFDGRLSRIVSDGYVDRASSNLRSFFLSGGYFGKNTALRLIAFSGNEKTYLAWNGVPSSLLQSNRTYNPSGKFIDQNGKETFYENETDNYEQHHFQAHVHHSFSKGLNASLALHYTKGKGYYEQYRANDRLSRYGLPLFTIGGQTFSRSDLIRRRWLDNDFLGMVFSWNYSAIRGVSLSGGGGANTYMGKHFGEIIWARNILSIAKGHRYYDNDATKNDYNTFVKSIVELSSRFNLFADLQYRQVSYSFKGPAWVLGEVTTLDHNVSFNFFNPKVGINYNPTAGGTFHLFAGLGNREPVRRDFTESSPESRPKPESMQNLEVGYRHGWKNLQMGANIYFMNYRDQLILTGQINDVGGFTRKNIEKSHRAGLEFEIGVQILDNLKWQANTTLSRNKIPAFTEYVDSYDAAFNWVGTNATEYKNTTIAFSPSWVSASSLTYSPHYWFEVNLTSKYVGKQYIDNTSNVNRMLDPYLVNDIRINLRFYPKFFQEVGVILQVNNVFNLMYETNAWVYKGFIAGAGITTLEDGFFPQAGRHFFIGTSLRF